MFLLFSDHSMKQGNGGENGEGAWFWWSKEGAEVYKDLYKYLYQLLTEEYGLHNLIWEFNSYTYSTSYAWYPGTEYVDIIGYDKYNAKNWNTGAVAPNESAISGIFYSLFNMYGSDGKMIAMAENDTIPNLDNLITEKAGWLYFCPWYGEHLMDTNYNNPETLTEIYKSDYVITLDELPKDLYTNSSSPDKPTDPTTTSQTEPSTSESKVIYGDANCDESVDISDAVLIKCYLINSKKYALSEQGLKNADVHAAGNGVNAQDAVAVQKYVIKSIDTLPIA